MGSPFKKRANRPFQPGRGNQINQSSLKGAGYLAKIFRSSGSNLPISIQCRAHSAHYTCRLLLIRIIHDYIKVVHLFVIAIRLTASEGMQRATLSRVIGQAHLFLGEPGTGEKPVLRSKRQENWLYIRSK